MRAKVTIVGAGMTGGTMAQRLAETGYVDVVLQDIVEGLPQGKALDLGEEAAHAGFTAKVTGSNDWADTADSDVVVITSGVPAQAGHDARRAAQHQRRHRRRCGESAVEGTRRTPSSSSSRTRWT